MQEDKVFGRILFDDEVAKGQGHGVPREDIVSTVDVLAINTQPT